MTERIYFRNDAGGIELPITDGTIYTDFFPSTYNASSVVVALYDTDGNIVTATGGTALVEMSPIKGQYLAGATYGNSEIDLTLCGENATYAIPEFRDAPQIRARITFDGVAGVDIDHAVAFVWGH